MLMNNKNPMPCRLFKKVKISSHMEVVLLVIILIEVLILAYVMLGLRSDVNRNFAELLRRLDK